MSAMPCWAHLDGAVPWLAVDGDGNVSMVPIVAHAVYDFQRALLYILRAKSSDQSRSRQ